MKRIFVEVDEKDDGDMRTNLRRLYHIHQNANTGIEVKGEEFFDIIIDNAMMQSEKVWDEIKTADEIYCSTAIIGQFGGDYGSPMLFNNMMALAGRDQLKGKKVFIFREFGSIQWFNLKSKYFEKVFKNGENEIYVLSEDHNRWVLVNPIEALNEML